MKAQLQAQALTNVIGGWLSYCVADGALAPQIMGAACETNESVDPLNFYSSPPSSQTAGDADKNAPERGRPCLYCVASVTLTV